MKVWNKTIEYLSYIITWDSQKTDYKSGPQLVEYFNKFWFNDKYENFYQSRRTYCRERIKDLNNDNKIEELIENYYNPINYIWKWVTYENLMREINEYLYFDDLELTRKWKKVVLENTTEDTNANNVTLKNHQIILNIDIELYNHINEFLENEDYFHAVEEAYKFVREKLKEVTWEEKATEVFKKEENIEKIFGHKPNNSIEEDFVKGVKFIHMWVQYLRNEKVHSLAKKMDKNEALHYIALASLGYKLISTKK